LPSLDLGVRRSVSSSCTPGIGVVVVVFVGDGEDDGDDSEASCSEADVKQRLRRSDDGGCCRSDSRRDTFLFLVGVSCWELAGLLMVFSGDESESPTVVSCSRLGDFPVRPVGAGDDKVGCTTDSSACWEEAKRFRPSNEEKEEGDDDEFAVLEETLFPRVGVSCPILVVTGNGSETSAGVSSSSGEVTLVPSVGMVASSVTVVVVVVVVAAAAAVVVAAVDAVVAVVSAVAAAAVSVVVAADAVVVVVSAAAAVVVVVILISRGGSSSSTWSEVVVVVVVSPLEMAMA